ncbi:hypothetical protein K3495_g7685 [Podosphaera aphanis]|nr:hypothetical protein K3495_g7685 [Podosphaera aphanis]
MILDWGKEAGVTFDPAKAKLLYFSRRRLPDPLPQVKAGSITVSENNTTPHLRNRAAKSMTVAKALSSLGNTVRAEQPRLLRHAAVAHVLSVAYFGAETWWLGRTRPRNNGGTVSNRVVTFLSLLSKTILAKARVVLPVFKTIPTAVPHRELGLAPPEITLNHLTCMATIRLHRLDPYHPLSPAPPQKDNGNNLPPGSLGGSYHPPPLRAGQPSSPEWVEPTRKESEARIGAPQGTPKDACATRFLKHVAEIFPRDIILYLDGSKLEDGSIGAGFVAYQYDHMIAPQSFPLSKLKEVFDAEARGVLEGL